METNKKGIVTNCLVTQKEEKQKATVFIIMIPEKHLLSLKICLAYNNIGLIQLPMGVWRDLRQDNTKRSQI